MKRARLSTELSNPEIVAAALVPDNTKEMETQVDGDTIETTVMRETTGGLRSTVDDYVVNLSVAERVVETAAGRTDTKNDQTTNHETQT